MKIEPFQDHQAEVVSNLIRRNLLEVNSKDYAADVINSLVAYFSPSTLLKNARSQTIFVATQDGEVVGTASLDNFGTAQSPDYYAVAVFVLPESQRQGIGLRLMEAVESKAKELGADKVTLRAAIKQPRGSTRNWATALGTAARSWTSTGLTLWRKD